MSLGDLEDSVSYGIFGRVSELAAKGNKVYPLAIGEPSFDTPTPIIEKAYRSMKSGATHYVSSFGVPDVRTAIQDKVARYNKIRAESGNVIFMTTKLAVYASILATCGGGGEVLIPDPGYFYSQPVVLAGSRPIRYKLPEDYSLDVEEIRRMTTDKTRAVIVNTPSNPTGGVIGKRKLQELLQFCKEKGIRIISDESYEDLVYGVEHTSIGSLEDSPDIVVSLFSLSKSFAMTGWRAGYAVGSTETIKLLNRFIEHTLSCFPPFIEEASAYALTNSRSYTTRFRAELRARRGMMESLLRKSPRLSFRRTLGAFYSFPSYDSKVKSLRLSKDLLEKTGVAVLPGIIFGPSGEKHLRISFAAPRKTIKDGMGLLLEYIERAP